MKLNIQVRAPSSGDKQVDSTLFKMNQDIASVINGNLTFGTPAMGTDNISGVWFTGVTPSTPGVEFIIAHNLGRVPNGFLIFSIDQAGIVYKGTTTWDTSKIFLKCNVASANVVIFIT